LPLLGTGALIYLFGDGIRFNGVLALTIAFGIAVDGTIHYFNYFFHFGEESKSLRENLIETSRRIGPQLLGTTVVIVVGMMTTQLSQMPTIVMFGVLVAATLVFGLVGSLVVLPALIAGAAKRWFTRHPMVQPAARGAV
jgi:predicted RND superfamily exporter protein